MRITAIGISISNIFIRINVIVHSSVDVCLNPLSYPLVEMRLVLPSMVVVSTVMEGTSYSTRLQGSIQLRSPNCITLNKSFTPLCFSFLSYMIAVITVYTSQGY